MYKIDKKKRKTMINKIIKQSIFDDEETNVDYPNKEVIEAFKLTVKMLLKKCHENKKLSDFDKICLDNVNYSINLIESYIPEHVKSERQKNYESLKKDVYRTREINRLCFESQ